MARSVVLGNGNALVGLDAAGQVVLIRQYRHPVRAWLVELPAGLLDVPGEPPLRSAAFVLYGFEGTRLGHFFYVSVLSSVIWVLGWVLLGKTFRRPISRFLRKLDGGNRWIGALEIVLTVASILLIVYPL